MELIILAMKNHSQDMTLIRQACFAITCISGTVNTILEDEIRASGKNLISPCITPINMLRDKQSLWDGHDLPQLGYSICSANYFIFFHADSSSDSDLLVTRVASHLGLLDFIKEYALPFIQHAAKVFQYDDSIQKSAAMMRTYFPVAVP